MRPSKQELITSFRRECPTAVNDTWSEEGLSLIFDIMEKDARVDDYELEFTPEEVCSIYCEESYAECIESFKLQVDFVNCQNEAEKQEVMKNAIKKYLEPRHALIAFTSAYRVISFVEVDELEMWQYEEMYG